MVDILLHELTKTIAYDGDASHDRKVSIHRVVVLIIAGAAYALFADSIPASIIVAALILFRAQRPSQFRRRFNEARYARQAAQIGDE